jgi:hypothetical protein
VNHFNSSYTFLIIVHKIKLQKKMGTCRNYNENNKIYLFPQIFIQKRKCKGLFCQSCHHNNHLFSFQPKPYCSLFSIRNARLRILILFTLHIVHLRRESLQILFCRDGCVCVQTFLISSVQYLSLDPLLLLQTFTI